jgi:hypothetical protein
MATHKIEEGAVDSLLLQITNEFYRLANSGSNDKKMLYLVAAMAILNSNGNDSRAVMAARKLFQKGM